MCRQLSKEELETIARLYQVPVHEREVSVISQRAIVSLGESLPVMHQVLEV